jgi:mannose-6-phosphate isomerase-like protein (cupin superfamily)
MIIKKEVRIRLENSKSCVAYEYPSDDKDMNTAFMDINGRYPDDGLVTNKVAREMIFVTEGEGRILIDGEEQRLGEGDVVLIQPNQRYFFEGRLKFVSTCAPAWYPEQHERC